MDDDGPTIKRTSRNIREHGVARGQILLVLPFSLPPLHSSPHRRPPFYFHSFLPSFIPFSFLFTVGPRKANYSAGRLIATPRFARRGEKRRGEARRDRGKVKDDRSRNVRMTNYPRIHSWLEQRFRMLVYECGNTWALVASLSLFLSLSRVTSTPAPIPKRVGAN